MLKLHGFPVSNYANMVQLALLEKGVPFEYVLAIPEQSEAVLAKSPRGKVPFLETPEGFINETSAILDYLEERGEGKPLLPSAPFARAQVRALMREIELYIELPARCVLRRGVLRRDRARGDQGEGPRRPPRRVRDAQAPRQVRAVAAGSGPLHPDQRGLPVLDVPAGKFEIEV